MEPVVRVTDLVQKVGAKKILDGVTLEIYSGECFGLFGLSGAGKTTFIHILAGIDRFRSGSVEVLGFDVRKSERFKQQLGLVTQEKSLFQDLKAGENLDFLAALKNVGRAGIFGAIERFELTDYLNQPVTALEAGIYRRLSMACALLNAPKLLLVDEPIQSLDPQSHHIVVRELKNFLAGGGTCIWSFSSMEAYKGMEVYRRMSRVGWLEQGRLTIFQPEDAGAEWERRIESFDGQSGEIDA